MSHLLRNAQASIVSDACCLEIICATDYAESIVSSVLARLVVLPDVHKETESEVLNALIDKGLILKDDIYSEEEENLVLYFASKGLGNGEAACCAVAANRGWTLASNEKKVASAVQRANYQTTTVNVVEVLRCWQEVTGIDSMAVAKALASIKAKAHYEPSRVDPLRNWWDSHLSNSRK